MPRVAKAVMSRTETSPWYKWTEEYEWDDDEFQAPMLQNNYSCGRGAESCDTIISQFNRLTKDREDEIGIM